MAKACMYNRNEPIMVVEIENGKIFEIKEIIDRNRHLLPVLFCRKDEISLDELNKWLDGRKIPDKREGLKEARLAFHGFERHWNMFSLTDQYWFQYKKTETWDKLNFFTNHYDQEQGLIFFEPWRADRKKVLSVEGPDLTTNGVLRKRWIQEEDKTSYLLKAGSVKYHQEPLSEVLASLTLKKMDIIPFVEYDLLVYGLQFCSKCQNFVTSHTEYVPASHVYKLRPRKFDEPVYDHFIAMCREWQIVGAAEYMETMIAVDHIMCNSDRHLGNFGFIRDADTGKILGFAPLFDFGRAYWGSKYVQETTSRYFDKQEPGAFKRIISKIDITKLVDTEDMEKIVMNYPEISEKQAETIVGKIETINKEIKSIKIEKKKETINRE